MTFQQELNSWLPQSPTDVQSPPEINSKAPSSSKLSFPNPNGKSTIITFLRHCGCPPYPHSSATSTSAWITSLGGAGPIQIIIDPEREIYAQWGLGSSSAWHVLNPRSMLSVFRLGREEKIWNRLTESGSRWQMSGSWVVDGEGIVKGGGVARSADDIMDFEEVVKLV
ncbi:hypothetical protein SS1G_07357 [Sclerotinia sclerotiorum 1980 UF-70]|uniref:Alkyl hydroperoxide reductase subunit C/ Thiol specific antioxidant domain-containing protein n=1 Tax=Sclerotinia sclerotiorum (strain ATCC 18683 / 1980 / Ss-1) TaxID=665079 RepID=A7EPV8_SCLS1|nr:hypothetical protein SS1G_07357 [Sclerotinia sclerotiorum 1980 UF-70]EDO04874.1 hypothetical protein SS1G_07357 [Sclerotinia sclerotiorum 1980 UF-70]